MRLGVLGEDVEDQAAPVEDLDLEQALERLLLVGRELVVGDEEREAGLATSPSSELLRLALAEIPVGIDVATVLPLRPDHLGAGRVGKRGQLLERGLRRPTGIVAGVDGDEEGTLLRRGELDQRGRGHARSIAAT